jgi:hypothetical protein
VLTPGGRPILLQASAPLKLDVRLRCTYEVVAAGGRQWELVVAGYVFTLRSTDDRELLAYHWHPEPGFVSFPHLHVSGESSVSRRMHLPTGGPVGLNELLRFLIEEYGVVPLRPDWRDVLGGG